MRALVLALALIASAPALRAAPAAEAPMTGAAFDAYSQGKTLYYAVGGRPYGAEQYLRGHRVIWAFLGQECRYGSWYEDAGQICFVYDGSADGPQCWTFSPGNGGLRAHYMGAGGASDLVEVRQSPEPLSCPGPATGV